MTSSCTAVIGFLLLTSSFLFPQGVQAQQSPPVDLTAGFASPPDSAKPHTWWHWMNGNVSKAGITLDLEAMKRVGIGGAHLAQVGTGIPKGPLAYDSPELVDCIKWAFSEADRLGLDLCMFNCPGWSSSGGPWITPENSMKVLEFTETNIPGGQHVNIALPQPPATQNFYRDAFVVAYPGLSSDARIPNFNNGGGRGRGRGGAAAPPADGNSPVIDPTKVIDLSKNMDAQGQLVWDAPPGNWTILRIGFTTTGTQNHPAPDGGLGLEVDKYSREALDVHFNHFFGEYFDTMKPLAAKGKVAALIDSYETGAQNWTDQFPQEFKARRGYDILPYMPAMAAGRVVGSVDISQRFLWDVRKTQAELMDEYYYGHFTELCHQHGMKSFYEPYDTVNFDEMSARASADMPMGEFWQQQENQRSIKLVASVMHMNGRPVMGAESFTSQSRWTEYPYSLKALGDFMWTQGLNKFVFHRFAMQPNPNTDVVPGMTMGPWGGHFDRTNTWFDHGMSTWLKYVARSQFLLQQGLFAGDLAYFAGEDSPVKNPDESHLDPAPPKGHGYDTIDTVTMKKRVTIVDGKITLPDGLTYRALVLPPTIHTMSVPTLQNIHDLVNDGMCLIVSGPKPTKTPSLTDYPAGDATVAKLADDLWGNMNGTRVTEHSFGKGQVFWGDSLAEVLERKLSAKSDFESTSRSGNADINYIHKHVGDAEVYFVANRGEKSEDLVCTFNVLGKQPELWDSDSGVITPASVYDFVDDRTRLPLQLDPAGSVFVVFRTPAPQRHIQAVTKDGNTLAAVEPFGSQTAPGPIVVPARPAGGGRALQYAMAMPAPQEPPAIELAGGAQGEMLAWQNGNYSLRQNDGKSVAVQVSGVGEPIQVNGPWHVTFPPKRGAPPEITLEKLISWTDSPDTGVKYFSGTATYTGKFTVPADATAGGKRLFLDLGRVQFLARVSVNGKDLGDLWKVPFRVEVTDAVHAGDNDLQVQVTNLWPNRLIGDEQLPVEYKYVSAGTSSTTRPATSGGPASIAEIPDWYAKGLAKPDGARITFTTWHHWFASDAPIESGLLGPVQLRNAVPIAAPR